MEGWGGVPLDLPFSFTALGPQCTSFQCKPTRVGLVAKEDLVRKVSIAGWVLAIIGMSWCVQGWRDRARLGAGDMLEVRHIGDWEARWLRALDR